MCRGVPERGAAGDIGACDELIGQGSNSAEDTDTAVVGELLLVTVMRGLLSVCNLHVP